MPQVTSPQSLRRDLQAPEFGEGSQQRSSDHGSVGWGPATTDRDRPHAIKVLSFSRAIRRSVRHNSGMANAIKKRRRQSDGSSKSNQVRALLAKGMSAGDIAKKVGCSTNLVYVVKSIGRSKGNRASGTGRGGR